MGEPARLRQRRVTPEQRLIEMSEACERPAAMAQEQNPHIVGHELRIKGPMRRIVKCNGLFQIFPTCGEFPEVETRHSGAAPADYLRRDVASRVAQLSKVRSEASRPTQIGSGPMVVNLAV
jgi:hypothetical protein